MTPLGKVAGAFCIFLALLARNAGENTDVAVFVAATLIIVGLSPAKERK